MILPGASVLLTLAGLLVPQRAGPVAFLAVVAPYWYGLLLVALTPLAVVRRDVALATVVVAASLVAVLAYPAPAAPDRAAGPAELTLLTWNLHGEDPSSVGLPAVLEQGSPDVIVLQEADATAIDLLPDGMQVVHRPDAGTRPGMLLASGLPVLASGEVDPSHWAWDRPRAPWISVQAPAGIVTVVGVHLSFPMPLDSLPCPYCPERRDAQLGVLLDFVSVRESAGERVVLAGDFNLSQREAAYRELRFLQDAGRGLTWRPLAVSWLPALLRLDYILVGQGIGVVASSSDCAGSGSDHCPIFAVLTLTE